MKLTMEQAQAMMAENGGSLNLKKARYRVLPDGLTVPGTLDLRTARLRELPENLTVQGDLLLSGTGVRTLLTACG